MNGMIKDYNQILLDEFDYFYSHYFGEISFEDYSTKVDVHYREKHGCFPVSLENEKIPKEILIGKLKSACIHVGSNLIDEIEHQISENEFQQGVEWMCEFLESEIEAFLHYRRKKVKWGPPYNRRFIRKDIITLTEASLPPGSLENEEGVQLEKALKILIERGLFKLIEKTSDSTYDVYEYVNI